MTDDPVDLDAFRGTAAQKARGIGRRRLHEFQADRPAVRRRREELEKPLPTAPAGSWPEASAKAH